MVKMNGVIRVHVLIKVPVQKFRIVIQPVKLKVAKIRSVNFPKSL